MAGNAQELTTPPKIEPWIFVHDCSVRALNEVTRRPRYSLLDVGAGSDTKLGEFAKQEGLRYSAMDTDPQNVRNLSEIFHRRELPFRVHQGSVTRMSWSDREFDVVHARGVLASVQMIEMVRRGIAETVRVSRVGTVIIEEDWRPTLENQSSSLVQSFLHYALQFFDRFKIQPFMASLLRNMVEFETSGQERVISRPVFRDYIQPEGNHRDELAARCKSMERYAALMGEAGLQDSFVGIHNELLLTSGPSDVLFTPPRIVTVTICLA